MDVSLSELRVNTREAWCAAIHGVAKSRTFVGKVMSLLFNMLSRLVITFLPRSKRLLISWLQSPSAVILEPPKIKSDTVSTVSPSISHKNLNKGKNSSIYFSVFSVPFFSFGIFTLYFDLVQNSKASKRLGVSFTLVPFLTGNHWSNFLFIPPKTFHAYASKQNSIHMYSFPLHIRFNICFPATCLFLCLTRYHEYTRASYVFIFCSFLFVLGCTRRHVGS